MAKASIYILIKVLAAKGFILLAFILFASFDIKVTIVLKSKKLVIILVLLYKNKSKLTLSSFMLSLIAKS
jgi:hypothetical protein